MRLRDIYSQYNKVHTILADSQATTRTQDSHELIRYDRVRRKKDRNIERSFLGRQRYFWGTITAGLMMTHIGDCKEWTSYGPRILGGTGDISLECFVASECKASKKE